MARQAYQQRAPGEYGNAVLVLRPLLCFGLAWLEQALAVLPQNYDLAVEVLACRRLVKGYSDTHSRGLSKFDRVMSAVPVLSERDDGAAWLRRLRQAALLDEQGIALDGALKTITTL